MQLRRLHIGPNALRRSSDRIEAVLLWSALVAGLLLVPFAAGVGTAAHDVAEDSAARYRASLQQIQAVTLDSAEHAVATESGQVSTQVMVRYADAQGVNHDVAADVVIGTRAGAQVPIWLTGSGRVVAGPRTGADCAALGFWAGAFSLIGLWLLLWGAVRLARIPLDRRRSQDWADEWRVVAPRWSRGLK